MEIVYLKPLNLQSRNTTRQIKTAAVAMIALILPRGGEMDMQMQITSRNMNLPKALLDQRKERQRGRTKAPMLQTLWNQIITTIVQRMTLILRTRLLKLMALTSRPIRIRMAGECYLHGETPTWYCFNDHDLNACFWVMP